MGKKGKPIRDKKAEKDRSSEARYLGNLVDELLDKGRYFTALHVLDSNGGSPALYAGVALRFSHELDGRKGEDQIYDPDLGEFVLDYLKEKAGDYLANK